MTALRRRMMEDMELAGLSEGTQKRYLSVMTHLAKTYNRSPDRITEEEIRKHVLSLRDERGAGDVQGALARDPVFLPAHPGRGVGPLLEKKVGKPKQKRLPVARSDEECRRLLSYLSKPRYRLCFSLMYACGLRISEAVALPITAIDSSQMLLRIVGKGNKERAVPLPGSLLHPMREFWKTHRHPEWLFPAKTGARPLAKKTANRAFGRDRETAQFDLRFTPGPASCTIIPTSIYSSPQAESATTGNTGASPGTKIFSCQSRR